MNKDKLTVKCFKWDIREWVFGIGVQWDDEWVYGGFALGPLTVVEFYYCRL